MTAQKGAPAPDHERDNGRNAPQVFAIAKTWHESFKFQESSFRGGLRQLEKSGQREERGMPR